jgi:two-component system nitrate/nitrite response regulator NarL
MQMTEQGKKIQILIADDHMLIIDGITPFLKESSDIELTGFANDGKELLQILRHTPTDVVLLDLNMPIMDGFETIKFIRKENTKIKIIILSSYDEGHMIEKAKANGANGYLLKNSDKETILQTIRLVAAGQSCFPYRIVHHTSEFDMNDNFKTKYGFSARETEILNLIGQQQTNQQIADKLFLSVYTVETHRKHIMKKSGVKSPAGLMKFILENNL